MAFCPQKLQPKHEIVRYGSRGGNIYIANYPQFNPPSEKDTLMNLYGSCPHDYPELYSLSIDNDIPVPCCKKTTTKKIARKIVQHMKHKKAEIVDTFKCRNVDTEVRELRIKYKTSLDMNIVVAPDINLSYRQFLIECQFRCESPKNWSQIWPRDFPSKIFYDDQISYLSKMTPEMRDLFNFYTGTLGFKIINSYLRNNNRITQDLFNHIRYPPYVKVMTKYLRTDPNPLSLDKRPYHIEDFLHKMITQIHQIINDAPKTSQNLIFFRSQDSDSNFTSGTVNKIYRSDGFFSTTLLASVAMNFLPQTPSLGYFIRVIVPKGFPILFMKSLSSYGDEYEFLFDHTSAFYIPHIPIRRSVEYETNRWLQFSENTIILIESSKTRRKFEILKTPDHLKHSLRDIIENTYHG